MSAVKAIWPQGKIQPLFRPRNTDPDQIDRESIPGCQSSWDPVSAHEVARRAVQVLGRARTCGLALALALTDPASPRVGPGGSIRVRVSELRALVCCDDEPIHTGMGTLVTLYADDEGVVDLSVEGVVALAQKPEPGVEAEWWVSTDPARWRALASSQSGVGGKTAEGRRKNSRGSAEIQRHACTSLSFSLSTKEKNTSINTSTVANTPASATAGVGACVPVREEEAMEAAIQRLLAVGITHGQPTKILAKIHTTLRDLPPDVAVEAAEVLGRQWASRTGGKLPGAVRTALTTGWDGAVLAAARDLLRQRSARTTPPSGSQLSMIERIQPAHAVATKVPASGANCEVTSAADPEAVELWGRLAAEISKHMGEASYHEWIRPLRPVRFEVETQTLLISVPSVAVRFWIEQQLQEEFEQAREEAGLLDLNLEFAVKIERC